MVPQSAWGPRCFLCNYAHMISLTRDFKGLTQVGIPDDPKSAAYQTRLRMVVSAAAYAYEIEQQPFITDGVFDYLATLVDLSVETHRPVLDAWFIAEYSPNTGSWVHAHPDLDGLKRLADKLRSGEMIIGDDYGLASV